MNAAVAALVVAAGASRRLGQPKQLVMHGGETLLGRAIRLACEAGAAPVLAVLGANSDVISITVALGNAIQVINERWQEGISTSIHAGLDALGEESPGVLILACDQPRLTVDHLRALMMAFIAQDKSTIVASAYAGALGIPAIFPRAAFPHLRTLHGDKGARALLANPPCPLISIPLPGGELDIDEPADLEQLK